MFVDSSGGSFFFWTCDLSFRRTPFFLLKTHQPPCFRFSKIRRKSPIVVSKKRENLFGALNVPETLAPRTPEESADGKAE